MLHRRVQNDAVYQKKPARELRQGGSYYRCCIPALAGFASPQSIAPDGGDIFLAAERCATRKRSARPVRWYIHVGKGIRALTVRCDSVLIEHVKWLAFLLLVTVFVAATSCATLVNRRDLYSPEPGPDSLEAARQWYGVTTTSTTTTMRTRRGAGEIAPPPDFRY